MACQAQGSDVELWVVALTCWFDFRRSAVREHGESRWGSAPPPVKDAIEPRRVVMVVAAPVAPLSRPYARSGPT